MQSPAYPYFEAGSAIFPIPPDNFMVDSFVPFTSGYPSFGGDFAYGYPATGNAEFPSFYLPEEWAPNSPLTNGGYPNFNNTPSSQTQNHPFLPTYFLPPHPLEPLSSQGTTSRPPSKPNCRKAAALFDDARGKWYCSACGENFHNRYECERHIENVGKQAKCLACGKTVCARKDNRRRHYTKYCKRMDIGQYGTLRLESAFVDL